MHAMRVGEERWGGGEEKQEKTSINNSYAVFNLISFCSCLCFPAFTHSLEDVLAVFVDLQFRDDNLGWVDTDRDALAV